MTQEELFKIKIEKPDQQVYRAVKARWDSIAKPLDGLGAFEEIFCRIGAIIGSTDFSLEKRMLLICCGDNGVVEEGISQSGQEVTYAVACNMGRCSSSACSMAKRAGCQVLVADLGIAQGPDQIRGVENHKIARGTANFRKEPAMTEQQALAAIDTGIRLVKRCRDEGYRLLATGEMGIGNTTTSAAIAMALLHMEAEEVAGRGAGLSDQGMERKKQVLKEALEKYDLWNRKPFEALCAVGGFDIAAMTGIFIGGAIYHIPVILDGLISGVAALMAEALLPGCREYMLASHCGAEPAIRAIHSRLGLTPVIGGGLALGEGTGALMLLPLLDMVMAVYEQSSSFEGIQVEQYQRYDR